MTQRITLDLTVAQAKAVLEAASRGMDEWDYEPEAGTTPNKKTQTAALRGWRAIYAKVTEEDK